MLYFWWGCRGNLKLITLGGERVKLFSSSVFLLFVFQDLCMDRRKHFLPEGIVGQRGFWWWRVRFLPITKRTKDGDTWSADGSDPPPSFLAPTPTQGQGSRKYVAISFVAKGRSWGGEGNWGERRSGGGEAERKGKQNLIVVVVVVVLFFIAVATMAEGEGRGESRTLGLSGLIPHSLTLSPLMLLLFCSSSQWSLWALAWRRSLPRYQPPLRNVPKCNAL